METHSQYMLRRAREEDDAADRAPSPKVCALHVEMAGRYRHAADGPLPSVKKEVPCQGCLPDEFVILE